MAMIRHNAGTRLSSNMRARTAILAMRIYGIMFEILSA